MSEDLNSQIRYVFDKYRDRAQAIRQLSFGNEGSALDANRFAVPSLLYLLEEAQAIPSLEVLSIETRPEYATRSNLKLVLDHTHAHKVDITVGFESQDDQIRNGGLGKRISRRMMENRIRLLGDLGLRLTSYVMLKPTVGMSEEAGVQEAIATVDYLADRCAKHNVPLVIYLNPTYVARGSILETSARAGKYLPPTIQSVARVIVHCWRMEIPVYAGLWNEEMAWQNKDFHSREGFDTELYQAIVRFNASNDFTLLIPFMSHFAHDRC